MSSQVSLDNQSESSLVQSNRTSSDQLSVSSAFEKVVQVGWGLSTVIGQIPQYWADFWQAYQNPVKLLLGILAGFITLKIVLAILIAINELPLLGSLLELVGLTYGGWFFFRNLVSFVNRQEILAKFQGLKEYVWGS